MIHRVRRWAQARSLSIAYVLLVVVAAVALTAVQHESNDRRSDDRAAAHAVTAALCHMVNDQQAVVADLLELVTSREGGGLPLTQVPEFHQLDPATQAWVLAFLAAAPQGPRLSDELERFAAERLVPPDCTRRR